MPAGDQSIYYPYFQNPDIQKTRDEIYRDMDALTAELMPVNGAYQDDGSYVFSVNLFPALIYEGVFVKGVLFSNTVDYLKSTLPEISDYYFMLGNSLQPSYPWSALADGYAVCYDNPERVQWFRQTYPDLSDKLIIPLTMSDMTSEIQYYPDENILERDIDVLCVSRVSPQKNLHQFVNALRIYRRKFGRPLRSVLITGHEILRNPEDQPDWYRDTFREILPVVEELGDSLTMITQTLDGDQMRRYYSRAKVTVHCSLLEGKCRAIHEAVACDSVMVCFRQFNRYIRGSDPHAFPPEAGLYAPHFDAESLAQTLAAALEHREAFHPRRQFLNHGYGLMNTLNRLLDEIPYYSEHLPGYQRGDHVNNPWIAKAIAHQFHVTHLPFFLRSGNMFRAVDQFKTMVPYYQWLNSMVHPKAEVLHCPQAS